jgi:signal transduction histidine kinase
LIDAALNPLAGRQRAEVEIAQRNSELAAQNAIAATISQTLDLDRILNTALDMVLAVLEMGVGSIYLLDADGRTLTLQVHRGDMSIQEIREAAQSTCMCGGVCRRAVNAMKPIALNVSELPEEDRSLFIVKENIKVLISAPLVSKGEALGAVTLGSRKSEAVPPQNLDLLAAIGQQIGIAVDNAHLYRDTERWAEELALLHEVSVFLTSQLDPEAIYDQINEQTAKLLGCQVTAIFLWDGEEQAAVGVSGYGFEEGGVEGLRMQIGDNELLDTLMLQRRFVIVEDAREEPGLEGTWLRQIGVRALLGLPLWGKATPMGFLFVMDLREPRRWQPDELELVESFINLAAIALENAHLHSQAERAAALEERQRIAADMHDGLAQVLSYMGLRADRASELIEAGCDEGAMKELGSLREAVGQASHDVRRSIASLHEAPKPRQSLQDWLSVIITETTLSGDPPIRLVSRLEDPLFLASDDTEQITRVVQEALTNAVRHAQADQIVVRLERSGGEVRITVEDDGQGFDPASPPADGSDHFGLSIMRARAARIGGKVTVESAPGQGARVVLVCPLDPGLLSRERANVQQARDRQILSQTTS